MQKADFLMMRLIYMNCKENRYMYLDDLVYEKPSDVFYKYVVGSIYFMIIKRNQFKQINI